MTCPSFQGSIAHNVKSSYIFIYGILLLYKSPNSCPNPGRSRSWKKKIGPQKKFWGQDAIVCVYEDYLGFNMQTNLVYRPAPLLILKMKLGFQLQHPFIIHNTSSRSFVIIVNMFVLSYPERGSIESIKILQWLYYNPTRPDGAR